MIEKPDGEPLAHDLARGVKRPLTRRAMPKALGFRQYPPSAVVQDDNGGETCCPPSPFSRRLGLRPRYADARGRLTPLQALGSTNFPLADVVNVFGRRWTENWWSLAGSNR